MKTLSYYSAKGTFPTKASFSTVYAYRTGALVFKGTLDEWYAVRSGYPNHAVETVVDTPAFEAAKTAYRLNAARLVEEFKNDLFEDNDVSGPKAERALEIAYEHGRDDGLQAVVDHFEDLAELIK